MMKQVYAVLLGSYLLLMSSAMATVALAQASPNTNSDLRGRIRFRPNPNEANLSGAGTPPIGPGGGSRGNCPLTVSTQNTQLTPIIPDQTSWSATSTPSILVYNPHSGKTPLLATMLLRDAKDDSRVSIAPITITLPTSPGIVKVPLTQPLEPKRLYRWYFKVICNPEDNSKNPDVSGLVRWVPPTPDLQKQIVGANTRQQAALYAENGYWYDALELLAKDPISPDWAEFLKSGSADLKAIASEKVLP